MTDQEIVTVELIQGDGETWEEVTGRADDLLPYPYMVSDQGRVGRIVRDGFTERDVRIMEPYGRGGGSGQEYLAVELTAPGEPNRQVYVHQLVAWEHLGGSPVGKHVDHINSDPHDNRAGNLRLVTPDQNTMFSNGS